MNRPVLFGLGDGLILTGVVLGIGAICFAFFPDVYESTVVIDAEKDAPEVAILMTCHDPYWVQTEFEKLQSKCILYPVISNLHLVEKWTSKFDEQANLKMDLTYCVLKNRLDIRQARDSSLIKMMAWSHEPEEAADIANGIAEEYRLNRLRTQRETAERRVETYFKEIAKVDTIIGDLTRRLKDREFEPEIILLPGEVRSADANRRTSAEARRDLEMQKSMRERLATRMADEWFVVNQPKELVHVVVKATPALHPNYLSSLLMLVLAVGATVTALVGRFLIELNWRPRNRQPVMLVPNKGWVIELRQAIMHW